jgi:hypothetical protein
MSQPRKAIEVAKLFADQADDANHSRSLGDGRFVWLSAPQAKWLSDRLREEGLAYTTTEGFGLFPVEKFQAVEDDAFRAQLLKAKTKSGTMRFQLRYHRK